MLLNSDLSKSTSAHIFVAIVIPPNSMPSSPWLWTFVCSLLPLDFCIKCIFKPFIAPSNSCISICLLPSKPWPESWISSFVSVITDVTPSIFSKALYKSVLGFVHPTRDRVIVIINNNASILFMFFIITSVLHLFSTSIIPLIL